MLVPGPWSRGPRGPWSQVGRGVVGLGGGVKGGRVEGGPEALGNCERVKDEVAVLLLLLLH